MFTAFLTNDYGITFVTVLYIQLCCISLQLIARADSVAKLREDFTQQQKNKSPHQKKVEKFVDYLNTQLLEIPQAYWFNFSIECMELIEKYLNYEPTQSLQFSQHVNPSVSSRSFAHSRSGNSNTNYQDQSSFHSGSTFNRNQSEAAAAPRQVAGTSYGGSTSTSTRNEPLQSSNSAFKCAPGNYLTPVSPPLQGSNFEEAGLPLNTGGSQPLFSHLTLGMAAKQVVSCSGLTITTNTISENVSPEVTGFSEDLFSQ